MNYKTRRAQSITELAIFGAIVLFLLAVLLTFGLRSNYHQEVTQHAFRRAMALALGKTDPGSYALVHDRHIPNPLDPHGVGSVSPASSSYSVTRSFRMHMHPDTAAELPVTVIGFGKGMTAPDEYRYTTANFARFCWAPCERYSKKKLETIFGVTKVWGEEERCRTVLDPCEGQIMSYDGCKRQCRMFTDIPFCIRQCSEAKITGVQCSQICQAPLIPDVPAYCGALDSLFSASTTQSMGLQSDWVLQETDRADTMVKTQSGSRIATQDTFGTTNRITRRIVFRGGEISAVHERELGEPVYMEGGG